ncbi:MAG: alkaline phosphatase family protein [Oscillospiraceae bacterium]|nr:alkaline phosphatase family protein [Oscillospiraceae bacterium]
MKKSTKTRLKILCIPLSFLLILAAIGGIGVLRDHIMGESYPSRLDEAEIFADGYSGHEPLPQTITAEKIWEHYNSPLPEGKSVKKALVIGLDGVRAEMLGNLKNPERSGILTIKEMGGGVYPIIAGKIWDEGFGAWSKEQKTFTLPGWTTTLTGEWADVHGVFDNSRSSYDKNPLPETVFTRLYKAGLLNEADFIVNWDGHLTNKNKARPFALESQSTQRNGYNINWTKVGIDWQTFTTARRRLEEGSDFVFLILEYNDDLGHRTAGFGNHSPFYRWAFAHGDRRAKQLIDTVLARPSYEEEDWLFIIVSDHGGHGWSHGKFRPVERLIFVASNKEF